MQRRVWVMSCPFGTVHGEHSDGGRKEWAWLGFFGSSLYIFNRVVGRKLK